MDAVKYIKEFNRMCRSYSYCSNGCPWEKRCGRFMGIDVDSETIEALVAIVEKWSEEHPIKTNGMKVWDPKPYEDMVSRQRLLSDLKELVAAWKKYPVMAKQIKGVEAAIKYVEAIPPAEPERKKGEWIFAKTIFDKHGCTVKCLSCHKKWKTYDEIRWKKENKFCPNCGADMRGEKDG